MAASPLEIRQYLRHYTLDDAKNGLQSIKLPDGKGGVELFCPPAILQFRYKETVHVNGTKTAQWTQWLDCPIVREGDEEPKQ